MRLVETKLQGQMIRDAEARGEDVLRVVTIVKDDNRPPAIHTGGLSAARQRNF